MLAAIASNTLSYVANLEFRSWEKLEDEDMREKEEVERRGRGSSV